MEIRKEGKIGKDWGFADVGISRKTAQKCMHCLAARGLPPGTSTEV